MSEWDPWDVAQQAVNDVTRRYYRHISRDDLEQEAWLWYLSHTGTIRQYQDDENEKRAAYRLLRDFTMYLEMVARKERAHGLGYEPVDEQFYSPSHISLLLPAVIHVDHLPPVRGMEAHSPATDHAEGHTWDAMVLDMERAWRDAQIDAQGRRALILYHVDGQSYSEIAVLHNLTPEGARQRVKRAERRLLRELGGERPQGCPISCECHDGPLRRRPGVHSATSGIMQEMS